MQQRCSGFKHKLCEKVTFSLGGQQWTGYVDAIEVRPANGRPDFVEYVVQLQLPDSEQGACRLSYPHGDDEAPAVGNFHLFRAR